MKFAEGDHRSERWSEEALKARLDRVEALREMAKDGDVADLALRVVLSNPFVTTTLVGARTPDQIRHAARVAKDGPPYLENALLKQIAVLPK